MKNLNYILVCLLLLLIGCSNRSYNSKDFIDYTTGNIDNQKLGKLIINFLTDLSEDKLSKKEKDAVFNVATKVFIKNKLIYSKSNEPMIGIYRFSETQNLDANILTGISQRKNAFPIFNRYRCRMKGNLFLNGNQVDHIDSIGGMFLGFDTFMKLNNLKRDGEIILNFKGELSIIDSSNNKNLYSRCVDESVLLSVSVESKNSSASKICEE